MPLFEVYNSMMKEKARAATQAKNMATSPEPFSTPEDEFGELIWDNGPRKKMMIQEMKDNAAAVVTKLATAVGGAFPSEDRELFLAGRRSARFGLSAQGDDDAAAEDDIVPWITYNPAEEEDLPREIPPEEDYCAEFLNEFDLNRRTLPPPADGRGSSGLAQVVRHFGLSDHGRTAKEGGAAGNLGGDESGAGKVIRICGRTQDLSQRHDRLNAEERRRQQQQERRVNHVVDGGLHGGISRTSPCKAPSSRASPSRGGGLINFSHFLRPVALAKASLEGNRAAGGKLASGHESTSGSRPLESTLVNSGSAFKCISATPPLTVDAKPASKPPRQESIMVNGGQRADTNSKKKLDDAGDADRDMPSSSFAGSAALSRHEGRRRSETADEASASSSSSSSSSSSGSSHGEASNNCKRRGKRKKHCEQDDEEEEEESGNFRADAKGFVGNAKHARDRGTKKRVYQRSAGTKRRRASEVHNLSERRRRDRINDRMKALQELIPNCNKQVDKASMLEEAIEYLKSLQFQLQMMSMGSGAFCMPQTVARCVQNFVMPTMTPPFAAMGMGLGFGMGMGMYNMSGSGSSNPMFPVPPVHPQQLAGANNSLAAAQAVLRGAAPPAAVSPQMFGAAGQGGPVLMPRLPLSSLLALPTKANMAAGAPCRTSAPLQPGADPLTPAVNSEGKGGRNLHGKAAQGPS